MWDQSQKLSTADLGADHDLQCFSDKIESKCLTSTGNIFSSNFGVGWVKKCSNGIFTANLGTDYDLQYVSDNTKKNSVKIFLEILVKYFNIIFQPQSGRRDDMQFSSKSPGNVNNDENFAQD